MHEKILAPTAQELATKGTTQGFVDSSTNGKPEIGPPIHGIKGRVPFKTAGAQRS